MKFMHRHTEAHRSDRIGWLRAAVLGANDGIVSTASLLIGVAAANASHATLLVTGMAGLMAGAMSSYLQDKMHKKMDTDGNGGVSQGEFQAALEKVAGKLGDDVHVTEGLDAGETVVLDPPAELKDGAKVVLAEDTE